MVQIPSAWALRKDIPMPIVALEKLFKQLESWRQDEEDRRFGDISDCVLAHLRRMIEKSLELVAKHEIGCAFYKPSKRATRQETSSLV